MSDKLIKNVEGKDIFHYIQDEVQCGRLRVTENRIRPNDPRYISIWTRELYPIYSSCEFNKYECYRRFDRYIHEKRGELYERVLQELANYCNRKGGFDMEIDSKMIHNQYYRKLLVDYTISGMMAEEEFKKRMELKGYTVMEVDQENDFMSHVDMVVYNHKDPFNPVRTAVQIKGASQIDTESWNKMKKVNLISMRKYCDIGLADRYMIVYYKKINVKKTGLDKYAFSYYYETKEGVLVPLHI